MENRSFVSDNNAGIHPQVLQAMIDANVGHEVGYGEDPYTARAVQAFRDHFGEETEVFLVFNGTAANVVSAAGVCTPYQAVICGDCSHIHVSESGAVERFIGCRVYPAPTVDGKLTVEAIEPLTREEIPGHSSQPRLLSITQATEWGTVYTVAETRALADYVHERGMLLHLDGARLANAAARPRPVAARGDPGRRGRHRQLRRHQERHDDRGGGAVLRSRAGAGLRLRAQAGSAAGIEDAVHQRPVRSRAARGPVAPHRRARQPAWPGCWPKRSATCRT